MCRRKTEHGAEALPGSFRDREAVETVGCGADDVDKQSAAGAVACKSAAAFRCRSEVSPSAGECSSRVSAPTGKAGHLVDSLSGQTGRPDDTGAPAGGARGPIGPGRIRGFDAIRGLAVISMVGFHLCYDLTVLRGIGLPWFRPPFEDVWRASISWTFLVVAGIMCSHSRSNLKRGLRYLALALAIFVVTSVAAVDVPISYGIIYCMGLSTLLAAALRRIGWPPRHRIGCVVGCVVLCVAFLYALQIPQGYVGLGAFGGPRWEVPGGLYRSGLLSWLGLPGPHFSSGDYYPPLPYSLLFLAGDALGRVLALQGTPPALWAIKCRPLEWVGRHALWVYVLHQPLLLAVALAM